MELAPPALWVDEVLAVVEHFGGVAGVLHRATDAEGAALYASMGVSAVYNPQRDEVRLGVDPVASTVYRRGDSYGMSTSHVDDVGDSLCCATVPESWERCC